LRPAKVLNNIKELDDLTYKGRLRKVGLLSLEKKRLRRIASMYKNTYRTSNKDRARLFSVMPSDRTRINRHKPKHRKLLLNVRKRLIYCEGGKTLEQIS